MIQQTRRSHVLDGEILKGKRGVSETSKVKLGTE